VIAPNRSHAGTEETRLRILNAAREIYERNGTRGTTTREVAERAGVNEATLFRHFGSKATLLAAMREHACGLEAFREIVATLSGDDVRGELVTIARSAVENMHHQRNLLCVSLVEEAADPSAFDAPEWRIPSQIRELLAEYFSQRVREQRLTGDPEFLACTFMGILFQYVVARKLWHSHVIDPTIVDQLVDVFLNGVQR
jgi:AcrR family transcriptional regulator